LTRFHQYEVARLENEQAFCGNRHPLSEEVLVVVNAAPGYPLTVSTSGTGSGTVTRNPDAASYPSGTTISRRQPKPPSPSSQPRKKIISRALANENPASLAPTGID
jgi:hypothetical protein